MFPFFSFLLKQAFGPQGAMTDTHIISLIACGGWQLLCDMPSAQGSGDGVGTPLLHRPLGRRSFVHYCATLEHISLRRQNVEEKPAHKNLRNKICAKSAHKSAHQNLCRNRAKTGAKIPSLWKMKARNKHQKKSAPNLVKTPAPMLRSWKPAKDTPNPEKFKVGQK